MHEPDVRVRRTTRAQLPRTPPVMSVVPVVLKVGGGTSLDHDAIAADVATRWQAGHRLVMVHGGASFLNDISTKLGAPPEFLTSESGHTSRRTDRRTLEIFEMVYCGS